MQHGITITRNDTGEIVGYLQGATFAEKDFPLPGMKSYIFAWDYMENDPYRQDVDSFKQEEINIHAVDDETAFAVFDHHYNVNRCENLVQLEKIVTFRDIPIPELA